MGQRVALGHVVLLRPFLASAVFSGERPRCSVRPLGRRGTREVRKCSRCVFECIEGSVARLVGS